jgi:hypothetical protein
MSAFGHKRIKEVLKADEERKRLRKEQEKKEDKEIKDARKGIDSPFYLIEEKLTPAGYGRRPSETLTDWLVRIETVHLLSVFSRSLKPILSLHYRFDPKGITTDEMVSLKSDVRS